MAENTQQIKPNRELTHTLRNDILQFLLHRSKGEKLQHGVIVEAAKEFDVHRRTISRLWKRALASKAAGNACIDVSSRKEGNCGRKKKDYSHIFEKLKDIPLHQKISIRSLSATLDIPKSSAHRILKNENLLRRLSTGIKPNLTDGDKTERLRFCLKHLHPNGDFCDLMDYVYIDYKCFYISKEITKVMFMAAVARPRWDPHKNEHFDGKIGIWPFIQTKGETLSEENLRKMLIENVLPGIRQKFPLTTNPIIIQQDSFKTYLSNIDSVLAAEMNKDGWNFMLKCQPRNSPDLNIYDLGLFNSIQNLQQQISTSNVDELIAAVTTAFYNTKKNTLDNVFLTLQNCMENIMNSNGCNSYKIVQMNKKKVRRDQFPSSNKCNSAAIIKAKEFLNV